MVISAKIVKNLRDRTGAGMMDCKEALVSSDGNIEKAIEYLRKSGIAKAEKKSSRKADQGVVLSYIHPGNRIGVMIEVNCETDFVAKNEQFVQFVKNLAMQVAATNPISITREEVDKTIIESERIIYTEQAKSMGKPENVVEKIVDGRMDKFFRENCLLEQAFIKDTDKSILDVLNETIASLGENINIARFARFEVGDSVPQNGQS